MRLCLGSGGYFRRLVVVTTFFMSHTLFAAGLTFEVKYPAHRQVNTALQTRAQWLAAPLSGNITYRFTLARGAECTDRSSLVTLDTMSTFWNPTLLDLTPDSLYSICITARNERGDLATSAAHWFSTRGLMVKSPTHLFTKPFTASSSPSGSRSFFVGGINGEEGSFARVFLKTSDGLIEMNVRRMVALPEGQFAVPVLLPERLAAGRYDFVIRVDRKVASGLVISSPLSAPVSYWYDPSYSLGTPEVIAKDEIGQLRIRSVVGATSYTIYRRIGAEACDPMGVSFVAPQPSPSPGVEDTETCYHDSVYSKLTSVPARSGLVSFQDEEVRRLPESETAEGVSYIVVARSAHSESLPSSPATFGDLSSPPLFHPQATLSGLSGPSGRSADLFYCGELLSASRGLMLDHSSELLAHLTWKASKTCDASTFPDPKSPAMKSVSINAMETVSRYALSTSPCVMSGKISDLEPNTQYCFRSCLSDTRGNRSPNCFLHNLKTEKDLRPRTPFALSNLRPSESGYGLSAEWDVSDPQYVDDRYIRFELKVERGEEMVHNAIASTSDRNLSIEGLETGQNYCVSLFAVDIDGQIIEAAKGTLCASTLDNKPQIAGLKVLGYERGEPYKVLMGAHVIDREANAAVELAALEWRVAGGDWRAVKASDISAPSPLKTSLSIDESSLNQITLNTLPYFAGEQKLELRFHLQKSQSQNLVLNASTPSAPKLVSQSDSDAITVFEGKTTTGQYANAALASCTLQAPSSPSAKVFPYALIFIVMTLWLGVLILRSSLRARHKTQPTSTIPPATIILSVLFAFSGTLESLRADDSIHIDYPNDHLEQVSLNPDIVFSHPASGRRGAPSLAYKIYVNRNGSCLSGNSFEFTPTSLHTHTFRLPAGFRLRESTTYAVCIKSEGPNQPVYSSQAIVFKTRSDNRVETPELFLISPQKSPSGQRYITLRGRAEPESLYKVFQKGSDGPVVLVSGTTNAQGEFYVTLDVTQVQQTSGPREMTVQVTRPQASPLTSAVSAALVYDFQPELMLPAPILFKASNERPHFTWAAISGAARYLIYRRDPETQCESEERENCFAMTTPYELIRRIDAGAQTSFAFQDDAYQTRRLQKQKDYNACTNDFCRESLGRFLDQGVSYFVVATNRDDSERSLRSKSLSFFDSRPPVLPENAKILYVSDPKTEMTYGFVCGLGKASFLDADMSADLVAKTTVVERRSKPCDAALFPALKPSSSPTPELPPSDLPVDSLTLLTQENLAIENCSPLGTLKNITAGLSYCIRTCWEDSSTNGSSLCNFSEARSVSGKLAARFDGISGLVPDTEGNSLSLTWPSPPTNTERLEIVRFEIQWTSQFKETGEPVFEDPQHDPRLLSVSKEITRYQIKGLETGRTYCARVSAVDADGNRALNPSAYLCDSTYDNRPRSLQVSVGKPRGDEVPLFIAVTSRQADSKTRRFTLESDTGSPLLQIKFPKGDWINVKAEHLKGPWKDLSASLSQSEVISNTLWFDSLAYSRNIENMQVRLQVRDVSTLSTDTEGLAAYASEWTEASAADVVDGRSLMASSQNSSLSSCSLNPKSQDVAEPYGFLVVGLLVCLGLSVVVAQLRRKPLGTNSETLS